MAQLEGLQPLSILNHLVAYLMFVVECPTNRLEQVLATKSA